MSSPNRIICLTEETTELLYLLKEEGRIVGITAYTVRPARAKIEKSVVTAFVSGSIPKMKALKPDLVIGFSDIQADLARDLIKEGLPVLIFNQRSIKEIFEALLTIGKIVGRASETQQFIDSWKSKLEKISNETRALRRPRIFFQEWDDPLITGIEWVSELIEIAGGDDCFKKLPAKAMARDRIVSKSQVAELKPEAIIGSWCGKPVDFDWIRSQAEWKDLPALKKNHLYEISSSVILQPGPALFLEGVDQLKQIIDRVRDDAR